MNREAFLAAAEEYSKKTRQWFRDAEPALREKEREIFSQAKLNVPGLKEAVTDLTTLVRDLRTDADQIHDQLQQAFSAGRDAQAATATAQLTTVALDRSIAAWLRLKEFFPEQEDAVLVLLVDLGRLRRGVEKELLSNRA
jgi:hypothetical protein